MKHKLKPSQYAVLVAIMLTASVGDSSLARGMAQVGPVDIHHLSLLWHALFNLYVDAGIVLLIGFFASYTAALSWADLTFVMPATAFGNVVIALLSRFWLHEQLSVSRWIGIALIFCAVGFVAGGPSRTERKGLDRMDIGVDPAMTHTTALLHAWAAIFFVAALAVVGEVLIAAGMSQLGDLDDIRAVRGLGGTIAAVLTNTRFVIGALCMALNFFAMLFALSIADLSLAGPGIAALTYIGNAAAAKIFLRENVDRRRWLATAFVALGVALLTR